MGQWSGLWTENVKRNWVWSGQFRTLVCSGVSSSCLTVLTSSGSIAVSETAAGVVYGHRETGLYTNGVRTLGSVREEGEPS
jgi:hypothetical protein